MGEDNHFPSRKALLEFWEMHFRCFFGTQGIHDGKMWLSAILSTKLEGLGRPCEQRFLSGMVFSVKEVVCVACQSHKINQLRDWQATRTTSLTLKATCKWKTSARRVEGLLCKLQEFYSFFLSSEVFPGYQSLHPPNWCSSCLATAIDSLSLFLAAAIWMPSGRPFLSRPMGHCVTGRWSTLKIEV